MDFEEIRDEVELKVKQAIRRFKVEHGILDPSIFTRKDLGVKARVEVYSGYDNGATNYEIQKAIEKVSTSANNESRKEREASEFLKKIASKGYYGYLKLGRLLGIPKESLVVRTWYGMYLPKIPNLINPGGEVKLMEGRFNISAPISIAKSYVAVRGVGPATEIYLQNNANCHAFYVHSATESIEGVEIANLSINGNKANQTADYRYGIYLLGSTANPLNRCRVSNVLVKEWLGSAIEVQWANQCLIENNIIRNVETAWSYRDGITVEGGCENIVKNNIVTNCGTKVGGIATATLEIDAQRNIIEGNYVRETGLAGIVAAGAVTVVVGNFIRQGEENCIRCRSYSIIIGNWCMLANEHGINIIGRSCIVEGNTVYANKYHGIRVYGYSNNIIKGNICFNNGYGSATPTYDGIYLEGNSDYNVIIGNRCYDDQSTKTQRYGINISASACDKNLIDGNILIGNATGPYNDAGTGTVIGDNITA